MADDAFIDAVELGIRPGPPQRSGVEHGIPGSKQSGLFADRLDDSDRVVAEDVRLALGRGDAGADLCVDGVHRDGLHPDEQIAQTGRRGWQVEIDQRHFVLDRQGCVKTDGLH